MQKDSAQAKISLKVVECLLFLTHPVDPEGSVHNICKSSKNAQVSQLSICIQWPRCYNCVCMLILICNRQIRLEAASQVWPLWPWPWP